MPAVPRLQQQVKTAALPGARLTAAETPESQGAAAALANGAKWSEIGRLGATVAGIGVAEYAAIKEQERDRADSIAALNAQNRLQQFANTRLYDPQTGALTVKGKDSFGLPEQVNGEFDQLAAEVEAGLTNDRQRLMFQRIKNNEAQSLDLTLRRHVFGQMQEYEQNEMESGVKNSMSAAIANANDPKRVGQSLDQAVGIIKTHGKSLGWGPETIEQKTRAVTSNVHTGVIEQLLAQDKSKAAQVYFEETKSQIDGEQIAKIEKALEEGTTRSSSQELADKIAGEGGSLSEQIKKLNDPSIDPKVRDMTRDYLKEKQQIKEHDERIAHEALTTEGKNLIDKTGTWRSISPAKWSSLTIEEAAALKSYAEHKATQTAVKTQPGAYYELSEMATSNDPKVRAAFQQMNLMRYVDKLSTSDFQQFVDAQGKGRSGDADKMHALLVNEAAQNQMVNEALTSMGLDPTPSQPGTKTFDQQTTDRINAFRRSVREAVQRKEQNTGKKATDDEVQSIVDQLRTPTGQKLKVDGWLWDEFQPTFAFETAQAQAKKTSDIPQGEREKITAALRKHNIEATDSQILRLFNLQLSITRKDR